MIAPRRTAQGGRAAWLVLLGVVGVWYLAIAPSSLGGPVTPLLTRGVSMEPTYHAGDLVLSYRDRSPEVGDVVLARHPSGALVLHRMVGRDAAGIITQGDNLDRPDHWRTQPDELLGTARFSIPGAYRGIALLRDPRVLGLLAAATVVAGFALSAASRDGAPGDAATVTSAASAPDGPVALVATGRDPRVRLEKLVLALGLLVGLGIVTALTASIEVTSDDLLVLTDTAPLDPTYQVAPGGGGGGGGGNCPPKKPAC